ncbi:MAG TPA: thiamine phosphate synthase [Longimicrobiaceae bacterium]|nr:thiamine phosphate synthase [Longimicrobiaceae bacterium]
MPASALPRLHVVTDHAIVSRPGFASLAADVLNAGGPALALHLRAPGASGRAIFDLAAALMPVARDAGASLIVNDRADVAAATGADGIHLPRRGLEPADARRIVGRDVWIGASVATQAEARAAVGGGADYVIAGSVFATESHPGAEPIGIPRLAEIAASTDAPVIAIGGVTADRIATIRETGAWGVAVVRAVWDAVDPAAAVAELLGRWDAVDAGTRTGR